MGTLLELFSNSLDLYQNKIAVIEDTGSVRRSLSYQELWNTCCIVSETLASICDKRDEGSSDLRSHQFVAVCMEQCLVYPAVILGILHQNFGFACVDPLWSTDKKELYLKKLRIQLLIHSNCEEIPNLNDLLCSIEVYNTSLHFVRFCSDVDVRCPHPMAFAVLTSGSTGQPKVVRVPHSSIVPNIIDITKICNITSQDIVFLSAPSTFDPSVVDIFIAFMSGASLLITSRCLKTSPSRLLHVLFSKERQESVTVLQMTPSVFNMWSERDIQEVILCPKSPLKVLILGGEAFPSLSKLERSKGVDNQTRIFNIYGITEVSSWASIHQVFPSPSDSNNTSSFGNENLMSLGHSLSDTHIQVRDCDTGNVIKSGRGEIFIGSSKRVCEVDNEKCSEYCLPVYRSTGDIVQVHQDGTIFYVGRRDNLIKRLGHRVCLENIENIALSHALVKSACCVWCEQKHKLYLIVALREALPTSALQRHFLSSVGSESILVPDEILQVEDIPLTFHGKVNRLSVINELLQHGRGPILKDNIPAIFLEVWCELLGLESLETPESSFTSLGGTSVLAVMLMTKIEQRLGKVPDNLAVSLISSKSFQVICDSLLQFYQQITYTANAVEPLSIDKESSPEPSKHDAVKRQSLSPKMLKRPRLDRDSLLSFSLRGTSSCGLTSLTLTHNNLHDVSMTLLWRSNLEKCIDASPLCLMYKSKLISIVIGSHSGKFIMVDGLTGQVQWSLTLPGRIESSACTSTCGQYVYVGCYDGVLYCINSFSGKVEWSFQSGGMIKCCPAICNNGRSILFGSYDFQVYCINAQNGILQWSSFVVKSEMKKGSWQASPLIIHDVAIICSLACNAAAVQTADGKLLWSVSFQSPVFSSPCQFTVASQTYVVIAEVKGIAHCLKALNGDEVWSWAVGGHIFAPLSVSPSLSEEGNMFEIFVGCYDCNLYCLTFDYQSGIALKWRKDLGATIGSTPFPHIVRTAGGQCKHCVLTTNSCGAVYLINTEDGKVWSQYDAHSEVFSSPVVVEDKVYFGCRDDNLYCLQIKC